jgi:hypothetical protein
MLNQARAVMAYEGVEVYFHAFLTTTTLPPRKEAPICIRYVAWQVTQSVWMLGKKEK